MFQITQKSNVLVVEDEPLILIDAVDMIEDAGFSTYEAANAAQALKLLETQSDIDVLFTDIDMPGPMDGLQLALLVRQRWPHISIIIVSGHARLTVDDMPSEAKFFAKPYARGAVVRALRVAKPRNE